MSKPQEEERKGERTRSGRVVRAEEEEEEAEEGEERDEVDGPLLPRRPRPVGLGVRGRLVLGDRHRLRCVAAAFVLLLLLLLRAWREAERPVHFWRRGLVRGGPKLS